tara:strand:- start:17 stop:202 length:186 start_codon:yes stop_codon:yes gene_type:complete
MTKLNEMVSAYTESLLLAITAPSDEMMQECIRLSLVFEGHLTDDEIETSKAYVELATEYLK